jgi:hypothetical protein
MTHCFFGLVSRANRCRRTTRFTGRRRETFLTRRTPLGVGWGSCCSAISCTGGAGELQQRYAR